MLYIDVPTNARFPAALALKASIRHSFDPVPGSIEDGFTGCGPDMGSALYFVAGWHWQGLEEQSVRCLRFLTRVLHQFTCDSKGPEHSASEC